MNKTNAIIHKIARVYPDLEIKDIVYTEFGAIVYTTNRNNRTEVLTVEIIKRQEVQKNEKLD